MAFENVSEIFRMSCDKVSSNFEIEIVIKEVTVKTEEPAEDSLKVDLEFLGQSYEPAVIEKKEEEEEVGSVLFANGCYCVDLRFKLSNVAKEISNEEFIFNSLGNPLNGTKYLKNLSSQTIKILKIFSNHFEAFKLRQKNT